VSPLTIEATPWVRRGTVALLWILAIGVIGVVWASVLLWQLLPPGTREATIFRAFAVVTAAQLVLLAHLIVVMHDVNCAVITLDDQGVRVKRWRRAFNARWNEVVEVKVYRAKRRGFVEVKTVRGSFATNVQTIGPSAFAAVVDAVFARAGSRVREIGIWEVLRLPLIIIAVEAAVGFVLIASIDRWLPPLTR